MKPGRPTSERCQAWHLATTSQLNRQLPQVEYPPNLGREPHDHGSGPGHWPGIGPHHFPCLHPILKRAPPISFNFTAMILDHSILKFLHAYASGRIQYLRSTHGAMRLVLQGSVFLCASRGVINPTCERSSHKTCSIWSKNGCIFSRGDGLENGCDPQVFILQEMPPTLP